MPELEMAHRNQQRHGATDRGANDHEHKQRQMNPHSTIEPSPPNKSIVTITRDGEARVCEKIKGHVWDDDKSR